MSTDVLNLLLVDDEPRLLEAWERLISAQPGMRVVGCLHSADDLEEAVKSTGASIVMIDHGMPGRDPLEAIGSLSVSHPSVRVIVYSGRCSQSVVDAAIDARAWGWIDKLAKPSDVLAAIRRVGAGETVFPE